MPRRPNEQPEVRARLGACSNRRARALIGAVARGAHLGSSGAEGRRKSEAAVGTRGRRWHEGGQRLGSGAFGVTSAGLLDRRGPCTMRRAGYRARPVRDGPEEIDGDAGAARCRSSSVLHLRDTSGNESVADSDGKTAGIRKETRLRPRGWPTLPARVTSPPATRCSRDAVALAAQHRRPWLAQFG
jgi:hypothetical protein